MTRIWLKTEAETKDTSKLRMLAIERRVPLVEYAAIIEGRYRVEVNTGDARGGYFVVIDEHPFECVREIRRGRWS